MMINRTCIITKKIGAKEQLLRIVRDKKGKIHFDPLQKILGRSVYFTPSIKIIKLINAPKNPLDYRLQVKLSSTDKSRLCTAINNYFNLNQ